jgi:hypothetical protein
MLVGKSTIGVVYSNKIFDFIEITGLFVVGEPTLRLK